MAMFHQIEDCLDRDSDNLRVTDDTGIALCSRVGRVFVFQSAASQPMRSTFLARGLPMKLAIESTTVETSDYTHAMREDECNGDTTPTFAMAD